MGPWLSVKQNFVDSSSYTDGEFVITKTLLKIPDHQLALERRLQLWLKGEFEKLYFKGETTQASLKTIQ